MQNFVEIAYEADGPMRVIRFNRPAQRNCIGPRTHQEFIEAWTTFRDDDSASVAVITGTGDKAFCAGGDLNAGFDLIPFAPSEIAAHNRGERPEILGSSRWTDIYKPVIAAVNGVAYAGGLEWACFADMRIAEEHASFGVTCRRWNIGLVNEVVPKGQSLARAVALAKTIAALPQPAIRTDKEAAVRGFGLPLQEGLRIEAECFNRSIHHPATQEGLRQFRERDHPDRDRDQQPVTTGIVRDGK